MIKTLILLAATLLALPAAEGGKGQGDAGMHRGQIRQRVMERFDTDGDHRISEAERAAAKAACLEKWDADDDGKLSEAERAAARAAFSARMKENHPKLFAKLDKDGDGVISREEGEAARAWLRQHRGQGQGEGRGQHRGQGRAAD